jgi:hypothetical protein
MAVRVVCPHCQASLGLRDPNALGRRVACPKCREPFVPSIAETEEDRRENKLPVLKRRSQFQPYRRGRSNQRRKVLSADRRWLAAAALGIIVVAVCLFVFVKPHIVGALGRVIPVADSADSILDEVVRLERDISFAVFFGLVTTLVRLFVTRRLANCLAFVHVAIAVAGLVALTYAAVFYGLPFLGTASLSLFAVAALTGLRIFMAFHLKKKAPRAWLLLGHGAIAIAATALLWVATLQFEQHVWPVRTDPLRTPSASKEARIETIGVMESDSTRRGSIRRTGA